MRGDVAIDGAYDSVMRTSPPLLAPLFRSEGQAAILAAVLLTGETLGLSDLATRAGVPRSSAYREVSRLAEAGLLRVETVGREWQVSENPDSPLTEPVRRILVVAFGPVPMLTEGLIGVTGVEVAVVFGSFAARATGMRGRAPSDIDVLVIGAPDARAVFDVCRRIGDEVGRPVNATIMSRGEWDDAVMRDSVFAAEVRANPTIPLIGELPWE